jgi:hypothetical protein
MNKDEALQMCLEYIETDAHERKYVRHAIKQALAAQQEHEPENEPFVSLASVREDWGPGPHEYHSLPSQPAPVQEPVAWIEHHKGGDNLEWDNPGGKCTPLYTTPPAAQRQWVGLTTAQRKEIERQSVYVEGAIRMTEAKLKEKNT